MIFMLDDEPYFMQSYRDALEFEGYEVRLLESEGELLTALQASDSVEALILDVMFPGDVDAGFHVFTKVREVCSRVPVIVVSNRLDVGQHIAKDRHTLCMQKSELSPKELVDVIRGMVMGDT